MNILYAAGVHPSHSHLQLLQDTERDRGGEKEGCIGQAGYKGSADPHAQPCAPLGVPMDLRALCGAELIPLCQAQQELGERGSGHRSGTCLREH